MPGIKALDYLAQPGGTPAAAVCALFGDDGFLKRQVLEQLRADVLSGEDAEFACTEFAGDRADPAAVFDELCTAALFGGGKRLVVLDAADEFVSRHRGRLEDYVSRPSRRAVLVLCVQLWPANTRLFKAVAESGLNIDCKTPSEKELPRWLAAWARRRHQASLPVAAAEELVEIVGPQTGLLDQELAKLAAASGGGEIRAESVRELVGGWRARTAWEMIDAALGGNAPAAIRQLDALLLAGEQPVAILAQVAATLRRFAAATRWIVQTEKQGRRPALRDALAAAGVKPFVLGKAEQQLRQLGRARGEQLYQWLLHADRGLKGASTQPPRLILERLLVRLGRAAAG